MNSPKTNQRNKRIAKNTFLLYVRMLITIGVSLYSVRIVLNTLGVDDYGLYNVVGGVVALLSFLPGSMASATQRFFSHALGQNDQLKLNKVFGVNSLIYLGIGLTALILLLTIGVWFLENRLKVPEGRLDSLVTVFYFSVFSFVFSIFKSPMMATIIAHEDMKIYAYVAILESFLKLSVVFLLIYLPGEKIVIYGLLLFIVSIIDTFTYSFICFRRYTECRLSNIKWDSDLSKEILGFTGWTLFGQLTTVARGAAITILLNQFFLPAIIAAKAIAVKISSQSNLLAVQFNTSLYPPIIKSFAANEKKEMYGLIENGSKVTFFLMWLLALPIFLNLEDLLIFWLKSIPDFTVEFAKLTLIEGLIFAVSLPLTTAARAPGKMAFYETTLGFCQLSILLVSWFFLLEGFGPKSVFYISISVNLVMFFLRLLIVERLIGLSSLSFIKNVIWPVVSVVVFSMVLSLLILSVLNKFVINFIFLGLIISVVNIIVIYFLGLPSFFKQRISFLFNRTFTRF